MRLDRRWRGWRFVARRREVDDLAGKDQAGVAGLDVVVLVGVDDLLPVRGYLGVRRLSAEVVLESVFGDVPEVVAPLHHDARGFGGCRCRRSRVGRRDRGRGIAGRVDGEQEDPAGVEGVVAGCDDGAIGKGASRVEVEDLLPPEPVAQCAFSDGPVAVVALHGDGRMSGRRCGNRGGVGEANEPDLVPVSAVQERVLDGRCGVDDRFGDDRYRLGRSGMGAAWLQGGGDHQHTGDESRGGDLEAGKDWKVDRLASSGDGEDLDHEREGELCPGEPCDDGEGVDDDLVADAGARSVLQGVDAREGGGERPAHECREQDGHADEQEEGCHQRGDAS
ncbi:MAG: hypothetical protein R2696_12525 [Microthrixaceae bacterium]